MFNRIESRSLDGFIRFTALSAVILKVLTGCSPESTNTNKPVDVQPTRPNISEPTATSVIDEAEVEPTANVPVIISTVEAIEAAETEEAGQPKELDLRGATLSVESGVDEDDDYNADVTSLITSIDKSQNIDSFTIFVYADRLEMENKENKLVTILDRDSGKIISLYEAVETASKIDGLDLPTDLLKDGEIFYAINGELRILIYRNNKWEVINHDKVGLDQLAINQINALMGTNYDSESLPFRISEDGKIIYDSYDVPLLKMALNENNEYEWVFATLEFFNGYSTSISNKDLEITGGTESNPFTYTVSINAFIPETISGNDTLDEEVELAETALNSYIIDISNDETLLNQLSDAFKPNRNTIPKAYTENDEVINISTGHKFHIHLTYESALKKLPVNIQSKIVDTLISTDKILFIKINNNETLVLISGNNEDYGKLPEVQKNKVINNHGLKMLYAIFKLFSFMNNSNSLLVDFSINQEQDDKILWPIMSTLDQTEESKLNIEELLKKLPLIITKKVKQQTSMNTPRYYSNWREDLFDQLNGKQT